jgi:hypothetical protein
MLNDISRAGICIAFTLMIFRSGCASEKKSETAREFHAGDPLTSYGQEITSSIQPFKVNVGEIYTRDITVKNTGTQPWYGHAPVAPVWASYRWLDSKSNVSAIDAKRTPVNNLVLQPGASEQVKLQAGAPPTPGSYLLWIYRVQDGVDWFYGEVTKPLILQVMVN